MKKLFYIMAVATGIVALASCAKEAFAPEAQNQESDIPGRFEKVFSTSMTKTTINGTVPSWEEGDSVKIFWVEDKVDSLVVCSTIAAVNADAGTISAMVGEARDYYYAVYPSWAQSDLIVAPSQPDSLQVSVKCTSTTGAWNRAHYTVALTDPATAEFKFKNISNAMKFTVTTAGVTSVKFTTPDNVATAGRIRFAFDGDEPCSDPVYVENKYTTTITVDGPGTYYAQVPYNAEWSSGFIVYEYIGTKLSGFAVAKNPIAWGRNYIYDLGTIEDHSYSPHDLYFKADGSGDGTDWDNAAGTATLVEYLSTDLGAFYMLNQNVYIAAGEYDLSNNGENLVLDFPCEFTSNFYGGYPATASGTDLTGRDIAKNKTIFKTSTTEGKNIRIFSFSGGAIGQWTLDGFYFGPATVSTNVRGYAMYVNGDPSFSETSKITFSNCNFSGIKGKYYGSIDINNKNANVYVDNCTFNGNEATTTGFGGAAIYVEDVNNLVIDNSTFTANSATTNSFGGALVINQGTTTITNSTFKGNSSATYGGAIGVSGKKQVSPVVNVTDCSFETNTAKLGGAINQFVGTMTCEGCTFKENTATYVSANYGGGAISTAYKNSDGSSADPAATEIKGTTYLKNCSFDSNKSYGRGGAIHEYTQTCFSIDGCVFTKNTQTYSKANGGAAIYHGGPNGATTPAADLYITNSRFEANETVNDAANGSGAAIATKNGANIYINNSAFSGNVTPSKGEGVISIKDGCKGLYMFRCSFLNNDTKACVIRAYNIPAVIANCTFAETENDHASGIILSTGNKTTTAINNLVISANASSYSFGNAGTIKTGYNIYSALTGASLSPALGSDISGKAASDVFAGTPAFNDDYKIVTTAGVATMFSPAPAASAIKDAINSASSAFYEWLVSINAFDTMPSDTWQSGAYQNK